MQKIQLHPYQKRAARFLFENPRSGLFADPGLGKTLMTLAVLRELNKVAPLRILIIAPVRVCQYVWPAEISKWGFDFSTQFLHGKDKTEKHIAQIELINPEGLPWLVKTRKPNYDVLIIDESSQFKNGRSIRFKLLQKWGNEIPRRHILTGTPVPRSMLDLWSQIYLLDQGESLGSYITYYRKRFFTEDRYRNFSNWTIRENAETDIWSRITHLVHRVDGDLSLPELTENKIEVRLPKHAATAYREMWKKLVAELQGETMIAQSAAVKYQMCCQITSGAIYDEEKNVTQIHAKKIDALKDLVSELQGKPLLIGYRYTHEGDRIRKALRCPVISGGVSHKQTETILTQWNKGELPVLAAQAQTISHGLNLQAGGCNDVCWFSLTDDFDRYTQFNHRVYRQGMRGSNCRIHRISVPGTVDDLIYRRLNDRRLSQQNMFDFLRCHIVDVN